MVRLGAIRIIPGQSTDGGNDGSPPSWPGSIRPVPIGRGRSAVTRPPSSRSMMRVDDRQTGASPSRAGPDPARSHRTEPRRRARAFFITPAAKVDNRQTSAPCKRLLHGLIPALSIRRLAPPCRPGDTPRTLGGGRERFIAPSSWPATMLPRKGSHEDGNGRGHGPPLAPRPRRPVRRRGLRLLVRRSPPGPSGAAARLLDRSRRPRGARDPRRVLKRARRNRRRSALPAPALPAQFFLDRRQKDGELLL
jgi:hypothetical protein